MKATGVRAEESPRRKGLWETVNTNRQKNGGLIICPILYWTEVDVWEFITQQKMEYCCLYDEGFKRLGCIGCPMAGKKRRENFDRWPGYEKIWKKGFDLYWNRWKGVPRKTPIMQTCPQCEGIGKFYPDTEEYEITVTCLKCEGTGQVKNYDRWIERMNNVEELWQWWMEEENVNDTDQPDCQLFLW